MKYYLDDKEITQKQALELQNSDKAHVASFDVPEGGGEPKWIRMAPGPHPMKFVTPTEVSSGD